MLEWIKKIFEIKDIVWFVIGLAVPPLFSFIKKKIKTASMRRNIKKNAIKFEDSGIVSMAHGDPFFEVDSRRQDVKLGIPQDIFYIQMPEEVKKQILRQNPDFFNTEWEKDSAFLDGMSEDEMLEEISRVLGLDMEETKQIYTEEKVNIANMFLDKVVAGEPYFVGEMYGIKKMQTKRNDNDEKPMVDIQSYKTDYYTHRVMAAIYKRVYKTDPNIVPGTDIGKYNKMRYFLTAMGMNVLLILEDEGCVVFAKRSGKLFNMIKPLWHVSMNEAISITDISEINKNISLGKCIFRGLNEELGVDISNMNINIKYSDVFYLKNPFETGISAFVSVSNLSFSKLQIMYSAAKDRELESEDLIAVKLSEKELGNFINKNELTDAAQYLIKMLLARHLKDSI